MPNDETTDGDRRGVTADQARVIANDVWKSNCKSLGLILAVVIGCFSALLIWGLDSREEMRDQRLEYIVTHMEKISESMDILIHIPQQVAQLTKVTEDQKKIVIEMNERITILEMVVK